MTNRASGTFAGRTYADTIAGMFPLKEGKTVVDVTSALRYAGATYTNKPITRTDWNRNSWRDWRGLVFAHPLPAEPTWDTMLKALVETERGYRVGAGASWEIGRVNDDLHALANEITEGSVFVPGVGEVVPPEGQGFAALIHLHDSRGQAGAPFREHRLRDVNGSTVSLRTRGELSALVTATALYRDKLHSAAVELQRKVEGKLADMVASSKSATERERAFWAVDDIERSLRASLLAEADSLRLSGVAPMAPGLARNWWIERLETAGAEHRRYVLGAETNQGMFASETTQVPFNQVLARITTAVHRGVRALHRSTTRAQMETAGAAALTAIFGIFASGAGPAWYEVSPHRKLGATLEKRFTFSATATVPQSFVVVEARPPSSGSNEDNCAITDIALYQVGFDVALSVPSVSNRHRATITYEGDDAPEPGKAVRLVGRNDGGPSTLDIMVAAPAKE